MSNSLLVLGRSGTGKSTSLRTLPPEKTLIVNVLGKPLPFKGFKNLYQPVSSDGLTGNYYSTDDPIKIQRLIKKIDHARPDINYLVLDDFGFTIAHSFMRKSHLTGFQKFSDIARETFGIFEAIRAVREDLFCIIIMHTEVDTDGVHRAKTIGRAIDNYINIEGTCTYVLHASVQDGQYVFLTNHDNQHICKTPMGCFSELQVPNNMLDVIQTIQTYNSGDQPHELLDQ